MTTEQFNHQTALKMHLVAEGGVQPSCACTVGILLTVLHVYSHVLMDSKQYIKPADATSQHITKGEKNSQFIVSDDACRRLLHPPLNGNLCLWMILAFPNSVPPILFTCFDWIIFRDSTVLMMESAVKGMHHGKQMRNGADHASMRTYI